MKLHNKQRDYLFDNYKVLLIFLVVVGHFIEPCYKNNDFLYAIKWLIVSFHMPAFIFISGYFSKRELPLTTLFVKLGIPYLAYEIIYYLLYVLILDKQTHLAFMYPKFSLWYLMALFFWRVITPYVKKIPYNIPLAIIAGLMIGLSDMKDNFLSIPRILVFYPFFLAGIYFKREYVTTLRKYISKSKAFIIFAVLSLVLVLNAFNTQYSVKIFYGRYNYDFLGQTPLEGMFCRMVCYIISFAFTFALMMFISDQKMFYSYIGTRTMAIYLFHGITYSYLKHCTDLLTNVDTMSESLLLFVFCAVLVGIFSVPQFTTFTNAFSSIQIPSPTFPGIYANRELFVGKLIYGLK